MLEGALILLGGIVIGRFFPSRRRRPKPPAPVKAICGCGHGLHDHESETGRCHAHAKDTVYTNEKGRHFPECTCQRYRGPLPIDLPEYFAPEIAD